MIILARYLSFFFLLLIASHSSGQKIRFSDTSNKWKGLLWSRDALADTIEFPYAAYYNGDTVIRGKPYKVLHKNTRDTIAFIREDSIVQKIFCIMTLAPDVDTSEQLLYDYSLVVGDTFRTNHLIYVVASKDSVLISALLYRIWHLKPCHVDSADSGIGSPNEIDVVEGIGCVNDPTFPLRPFSFETIPDLMCFTNRGTFPILSHIVGYYFDNSSSCAGINETGTIAGKNVQVSAFPNPATDVLNVYCGEDIRRIIITDISGQTLYAGNYRSQRIGMDIGWLPTGVYLIRINDVLVQRFLKE